MLSLGATIVSNANSIIPSDSSKTTTDGVSVSTIKTMKNIGVFLILIGIALMFWYGWAVFVSFGGVGKTKSAFTEAERRFGEWRKRTAGSAETVSSNESM